ncbi:MAG: MBL fold metallo-hydrolase [Chitinophagia bacterium]|jgi:glyoxylase-like metal-dependent hydrolase (beta-lactamase superfamily II)
MKAYSIDTGKFKLDGGAMFGVVPKSIWNKSNPADENNLCTWALRCLLVIEGERKILIDTGMGSKQDEKFFSHYHPHETVSLTTALQKLNIATADITDVLLTHLHFDHVGGAVIKEKENLSLQFPNATYWVSEPQWNEAMQPNRREKASFLAENILPLQQSGQLKIISLPQFDSSNQLHEIHFSPSISCFVVNGHTKGMLIPKITLGEEQLVFMADLLPSIGHIPLPYIMGYDMQPLITLAEKELFLKQAVQNHYTLFFEHDAQHECCTLQETEKGIRLKATFNLATLV